MRKAKRGLPRSRPSAILVDTNLLLLLFVGVFDIGRIKRFKRTYHFSERDFHLLVNLLKSFERVVTTPHILTEVSNLAGQMDSRLLPGFYSIYGELVGPFEELTWNARDIVATGMFKAFGLTDAVIGVVGAGSIRVLTDDAPLAAALAKNGVDVVLFNVARNLAGFND